MAAIDLSELIPALVAEVSPPGEALYTGVSDDDWITYLLNGFWSAHLEGVLDGWTANEDGIVTPLTGDSTMGRDLQQIPVLYAAMTITRNELRRLNTLFRSKAGPVEFETQQSAQVLKGVLESLTEQKKIILDRLSSANGSTSFYIDAIISRDYSINNNLTHWIGF